MKLPFESDRNFTLFAFIISHGLLLLRSGKTEAHPTRLDILFQDVRWIGIPAWMNGVLIEKMDSADLPVQLTPTIESEAHSMTAFHIRSEGISHYLLASATVTSSEDEEGFFTDSPLLADHNL